MSDFVIQLSRPVTVRVRKAGSDELEPQDVSELEMREPRLGDFADVTVNNPTMGQLLAVACRCCKNIPAATFNTMPAENLMPVASWVGGFLQSSR